MMATYFNSGSEIHDAFDHQTLYLMNPTYVAEQHLVGIPLAHPSDLSRPSSLHVIRGSPAAPGMGVTLGSRYVKATWELLDEVVSVADSEASKRPREKAKAEKEKESDEDDDGARNGGVKKEELSSAQRQELHMNKANLLNMLHEVEQSYKQYQTQMHRVASVLEQAAGAGSAKSYTSLALHTISKQFRCLKDAIASQVKETGTRMGEDEDEKEGGTTSTRLRMVAQRMRQQRAMQELGMMMHYRHSAWRPQRGLPERAVSVLRAWLFEHFLHPYPKDSDKHMLAKQTGLTRSQVSNWFINARVRLWKPMVEEMHAEEMKVAGQHQNDSGEANTAITTTTTTTHNNNDPNKEYSSLTQKPTPSPPLNNFTLASSLPSDPTGPTLHTIGPDFSHIGPSSSRMESILIQRSPTRQRNSILDIHSPSNIISMDNEDIDSNKLFTTPDHGSGSNNYPIINSHIGSKFNPEDHHNQQLGQGRYHHMSLTLGLPHCENLLSLSADHPHQHRLFSGQAMHMDRTSDVGEPEWCGSQPDPHPGAGGPGYDGNIDIQTGKRFEAQLLPDFVA